MRHACVSRQLPAFGKHPAVFKIDAEKRIEVRAEKGVLRVVFGIPFVGGVTDADAETRVEHVSPAFQKVETHVRVSPEYAPDFGHPAEAGINHRDADSRVVEQLMPRLGAESLPLHADLEYREMRPEKLHLLMMAHHKRPTRPQFNLDVAPADGVAVFRRDVFSQKKQQCHCQNDTDQYVVSMIFFHAAKLRLILIGAWFFVFLQKFFRMDKRLEAFKRLLDIMDDLRAGCPWDKKQTIESLRHLTIEETFELSEAIIASDYQDVKKELGDLIMHIVFYSKIADERGLFDISDVINSICDKLIVRHPHIYGTEKVESAEEVLQNWEKIKIKKEGNRSVLGGVPAGLPPLLKAYRMTDKASGVGFDWENKDDCWKKVLEEMDELQEVVRNDETKERKDEELGDLLFALVNYSRFIKVNADDALEHANAKFKRRFTYIEDRAREMGRSVADMTLDEMEELWQEAKRGEK